MQQYIVAYQSNTVEGCIQAIAQFQRRNSTNSNLNQCLGTTTTSSVVLEMAKYY